jgi:hypothetical protein
MEYEFHPLADLFPRMTDEELRGYVEERPAQAIILYTGTIPDDRNRDRACLMKDIEPRFREELPADLAAFVASANFHRRHLDESTGHDCDKAGDARRRGPLACPINLITSG